MRTFATFNVALNPATNSPLWAAVSHGALGGEAIPSFCFPD